jgi:uncharacterized protein YuzB (UPF0349 family)
MEVKYCERCHNKKRIKSIKKVEQEFKAINQEFVLVDQCLSFCGPGKDAHFCQIDDEMYICENYDQLLESVGEDYDN